MIHSLMTDRETRKWSWEIFTASMFIGLGLGMILGEPGAGIIFGMGAGFILGAVFKVERGITLRLPKSIGAIAMIIIGLGFIGLGLEMLGYLPQKVLQQAGGLAFIGLGILMLLASGFILKQR